jgi:prepilin signal peptidase PulO-like enzyme (type II secretory pathway)
MIKKVEGTTHGYLAYVKSLCGKATYFLHFQDAIWGAVTLHMFIEMLRSFFKHPLRIELSDKSVEFRNSEVLKLLEVQEEHPSTSEKCLD